MVFSSHLVINSLALTVSNVYSLLRSEKLKLHGEKVDLLPHVLLRKYIAYARKYVPTPCLSAAAAKVLQHFYLELRRQHQTQDATPVTTRQLESLIRLTQVFTFKSRFVFISNQARYLIVLFIKFMKQKFVQ